MLDKARELLERCVLDDKELVTLYSAEGDMEIYYMKACYEAGEEYEAEFDPLSEALSILDRLT